jgi:hypothetical protein
MPRSLEIKYDRFLKHLSPWRKKPTTPIRHEIENVSDMLAKAGIETRPFSH